ncbi:MAG: Uma2 family endonuclease [Candidatus Promineifilaceae bacterium]
MAEIVLEPEIIEIPEPDLSNVITEDDEPVDNIFSEKQQRLLTETLYTSWRKKFEPDTHFVALANVGLFYAVERPAIVPDVMVSLDVELPEELWEKKHRSYFFWEYGKPPEIVIEIVSNRKGRELTTKKALYARLGIAYYIVFDPYKQLNGKLLHVFERRASEYVSRRKYWLPVLGLGLELWEGTYEGHEAVWLRWVDEEGNLLLTGEEAAEQERQRAERLAAQLRALGVEPEE